MFNFWNERRMKCVEPSVGEEIIGNIAICSIDYSLVCDDRLKKLLIHQGPTLKSRVSVFTAMLLTDYFEEVFSPSSAISFN